VKVCLYTYIQIYLYTWSMPRIFIKERFWVLPFVVQRVISKIGCGLWSVYMYIQSVRKDRIRSVLCAFAQEDPVPGYMDHNAHGSVVYMYRIRTYGVLRHSYNPGRSKLAFLEDMFLHQPDSCVVVSRNLVDRRYSEICGLDLTHYRVEVIVA